MSGIPSRHACDPFTSHIEGLEAGRTIIAYYKGSVIFRKLDPNAKG